MFRHLRLWRRFVAQAFVRDTHYRVHFVTTLWVGVVQLGLALVPILLLFGYTSRLHGWSRADVIALVGIYQIVSGLLAAFVAPNLGRMTRYITEGELDTILVRPVSAQFFAMFRWIQLAELGNVATGLVIAVVGLARAGAHPGAVAIAKAVLLLGCGLVLLTCVWSALAFLAFWLQSVAPLPQVFISVLQAGQYPLPFFPTTVRAFLTFAFPVAFATSFPTQALSGRIGWLPVAGGTGLCVAAIAVVCGVWRLGIRSYASASS